MHVQSVLQRKAQDVATLRSGTLLSSAAGLLAKEAHEIVVICDDNDRIVGVVTDSDVLRHLANSGPGTDPCAAVVDRVMTKDVVCCAPETTLDQVLGLMKAHGLRRIPVVDGAGKLKGVITVQDVLSYLYEESKLEQEHLREYFFGLGYR